MLTEAERIVMTTNDWTPGSTLSYITFTENTNNSNWEMVNVLQTTQKSKNLKNREHKVDL